METQKENQQEKGSNNHTSDESMTAKESNVKKNEYTAQENEFADGEGSHLEQAFDDDNKKDQQDN